MIKLHSNREPTLLQDFAITSNSSGNVGFGAISGKHWFAQVWPRDTTEIDITIKEFIPICIVAVIWGYLWPRKRIKFKTDNSAVVPAFSRDRVAIDIWPFFLENSLFVQFYLISLSQQSIYQQNLIKPPMPYHVADFKCSGTSS